MPHEPPQDLPHQSTMREWASSQAACLSFIVALLGMVIGSPSTSNRWIGPQLGWLSGAAVYAHAYGFVCSGVWLRVLAQRACNSHQNNSTSVSLHLLSLSLCLSFEFRVLSIIANTAVLCRWLRMVFLWTKFLDLYIKLLSKYNRMHPPPMEIKIQDDTIRTSVV